MVIPNKVTNPTIAPTDSQPPDIKTAKTPPTRQKGRFTIVNILDIDLDYASKVVEDLLNKKYIEY